MAVEFAVACRVERPITPTTKQFVFGEFCRQRNTIRLIGLPLSAVRDTGADAIRVVADAAINAWLSEDTEIDLDSKWFRKHLNAVAQAKAQELAGLIQRTAATLSDALNKADEETSPSGRNERFSLESLVKELPAADFPGADFMLRRPRSLSLSTNLARRSVQNQLKSKYGTRVAEFFDSFGRALELWFRNTLMTLDKQFNSNAEVYRAQLQRLADAGWFTRVKSSAHILLLNDRRLHIIPHPRSGDSSVELDLQQLIQFETGNNLLFGWVAFDIKTENVRLNYNTRASEPLERLLVTLKRRWLSETGEDIPAGSCAVAGPEIDVKFRSILDCELDPEETAQYVYFSPPLQFEKGIFSLKRRTFRAGHLLTVTSQGRLLWLRDDYRGA